MQRKWYKKKRNWLLVLLMIWFILSRMEFAKMRYAPDQLSESVQVKTNIQPTFDTRKIDNKTIQFIKVGERKNLPLIVFVHGSPGALNAYEDYFSDVDFLKYADMISVDRPGFGYSDFGKSESSLMIQACLLYTSPSPRDATLSRMPSSA